MSLRESNRTLVGRHIGVTQILALLVPGAWEKSIELKTPGSAREVAVKILPADFSTDAERLRRFEQEARAAGRLNHPNIVAIYDIGTYGGRPYIVSELLEGETLRDQMKGTALPTHRADGLRTTDRTRITAAHRKGSCTET